MLICMDFIVVLGLHFHLYVIPNILKWSILIGLKTKPNEYDLLVLIFYFLTPIRWRRRSRSLRRRPRYGGPNGRPTTRLCCRWQKRWQEWFRFLNSSRTVRNFCCRAMYIYIIKVKKGTTVFLDTKIVLFIYWSVFYF